MPENKDDAKEEIEKAKTNIIDRKNMHDKKIMLHEELSGRKEQPGLGLKRNDGMDISDTAMANSAFGMSSNKAKENNRSESKIGNFRPNFFGSKASIKKDIKPDFSSSDELSSPFSGAKKRVPPGANK